MSKSIVYALSTALALAACGGTAVEQKTEPSHTVLQSAEGMPLELPIVDPNVKHDTLLVQVAFAVGDGTYLMVASNVTESFEGLRLYHYRAQPDSSTEIIAVSAPGYDSWTMLPTVFGQAGTLEGSWVLANFGERGSWGQKIMRYDGKFRDHGFMDIALPERVNEPDTGYIRLTSIAPHIRIALHNDTTSFTLACDSVYMYDDLDGHNDIILPANTVHYTYHPATGLVLWVNGSARIAPAPPA